MIFLNKDIVIESMNRMKDGFRSLYGVEVELFEEDAGNLVYLGYQFEHNGKAIKMFMPYTKQGNEFAQNVDSWTVKKNDGFHASQSFKTIGGVMDFLNIKRLEKGEN